MVSTRGKKKTASSHKTLEENEATEHTLDGALISDSLTVNVEEPRQDAQLEAITVDEARNERFEEMSGEEESEKVMKVDNDDENTAATEMSGENKAESEENTFEGDEIDDQEDTLRDDDEENSEYDNEERVVYEYEFSEEEATEEDDEDDEVSDADTTDEDDDEDEVSEEEAIQEEDEEQNAPEEKEIAKGDAREAKAKEDGKEAGEPNSEKLKVSLKNIKKSSERSRKKKVQKKARADRFKKVDSKDKSESSRQRKVKKRVESMGMIFMCSSKTKSDCYQYRVLGLPESKKDIVEKIYTGMRLFLYDVDLKLMYGIYKAAGPGGYNIEPKAFNSQFPSQVRFKVLDNCMPLAEEKFKKVIKDNYFTKTKFDCQLNSEQVKKLCKLFIASSKGRPLKKLAGSRKTEKPRIRQERTRRQRADDERRLPLREEVQYRQRPRKRRRKIISPAAPLRQHLPAPLPSTVPSSYVYERTSGSDAYRRDPYLERRSPYRNRRDRLSNCRDPHGDWRDPPIEHNDHYRDGRDPPVGRNDHYRDGRDPYLQRHYAYRDGRDPYIERRDPYRDDRDPYPRRSDPYRDGQGSYLELPDLYRDRQDPYIERHDSYRDRGSYLERRVPYRGATYSELYDTYRRDPLSDRRDVYREDRGVEYRDSYRREETLEHRDLRQRHDIGGCDSYVSNRQRPAHADIYPAEYTSRAGVYRL